MIEMINFCPSKKALFFLGTSNTFPDFPFKVTPEGLVISRLGLNVTLADDVKSLVCESTTSTSDDQLVVKNATAVISDK